MIQIDMQMPERCGDCPFNYDFCSCMAFGDYDEWEKYRDDWNDHVCDRETRPEYCPLKEQEAPSKEELIAHYGKMYKCRKCGLEWYQQTQKYCQECGTVVKWE